MTTYKAGFIYMSVIPQGMLYYVGSAKKFWEDEGFHLQALELTNPSDGIQALGSELIFMNAGVTPGVVAFNKGNKDLRILGPLYNSTATRFVAKAGSPIKSIKDVHKGIKIGLTAPGTGTQAFEEDMVAKAGLTAADVRYQPVSGGLAAINAALLTGQIDVAPMSDPVLSKEIHENSVQLVWDPTSEPGFKYNEGVLLTTQQITARDPSFMKALARALDRTNKFIEANTDETASIWAKAINIPVDIATDTLKGTPKGTFSSKTDWSAYLAVAKQMDGFGQLKPSGKIAWKEEFGDQSFLPSEDQTPMPADLPFS